MVERTDQQRNEHSVDPGGPAGALRPLEPRTQAQRRRETRGRITEATFALAAAGAPFEALTLRQIAQQAGVAPSAFYRYFADMEELGVALVDESFEALRSVLQVTDVVGRSDAPTSAGDIVAGGLELLCDYLRRDHRYLAFVARQRVAGSPVIRRLIRNEIRLVAGQMATFIARFDPVRQWPTRDAEMLAQMIIGTLMSTIDQALEVLSTAAGRDNEQSLDAIQSEALRRITYLWVGTASWQPRVR